MPRKRKSDVPTRPRQHFIKEWREYRGLKQIEVAAELGEHPSSISQLEAGKQGYTQWKLESLARIFQTDPCSLLCRDPLAAGNDDVIDVWNELREPEQRQALALLRALKAARASQ